MAAVKESPPVCAICGQTDVNGRSLVRDHCHRTGVQRALLCGRCNVGLGMFQDNPARLRYAAQYVEHHRGDREILDDLPERLEPAMALLRKMKGLRKRGLVLLPKGGSLKEYMAYESKEES